jgi:hypothetical protein
MARRDAHREYGGPWLPVVTAACAVLVALTTNVAASLVPSEWTHDHQAVVWGAVALLAASSMLLAAAAARRGKHSSVFERRIEAEEIGGPIVVVESGAGAKPGEKEPVLPSGLPFLDRKREMGKLVARVCTGEDSLLAIEGDRWVGKSATTQALVQELRSAPLKGYFDPGVRRFVWLDAHDGCPSLAEICGLLAIETGEQALSAAPDSEKPEALRAHLARSGTVLVLDNLRLSDDRRSRVLTELLEDLPRGSLVIASVNRSGALVAPRVTLGDLDEITIRELVADRVERLGIDGAEQFDERFCERLHTAVGGNPGVIEWFLRGYRDSSEPLEQHITAVEKGGELSELFEPTWRALSSDHRRALEGCAYLGGEATARQIAIACERDPAEMASAGDELRREGLLSPVRKPERPTVFTCAKALQLFVEAKMPNETRTAFSERLADHYIRHFTDNPEDTSYGLTEVGALRVVREQLFEREDDARIQALFWVTLDILFTLGQFDELIAAAELSFISADRAQNFCGAALCGVIEACTHAIRGERKAALDAYANGRLAAQNSGLPGPIARAKRCRAFLHYRADEPRRALAEIEGVEELAREGNDPSTIVDAYDLRTAANWHLRRLDACEAAARGSLEAGVAIGWERARSFPLRYMAELAIQHRRPQEARRLLDEARGVAQRFDDRRQLARIDLTEARLGLFGDSLDAGSKASRRAVAETTRLGLPPEREEATALARALGRAQRSRFWRGYYRLRRPTRLSGAPVGGD